MQLFLCFPRWVNAQLVIDKDTLYGNEWINYRQSYYKIQVPEDGIYRLTSQTMSNAGIPLTQIRGVNFQLFLNGKEVPLFTSTDGVFGSADYLEFYGEKNKSQLDRHLFKKPDEEMMNPHYSMFTDSSAYFLTWNDRASNPRYQTLSNNLTNLPPRETHYVAELLLNFFNVHRKKQDVLGISSSDFGPTEGFSSAFANTQSFTLNPTSIYAAAGFAKLRIRYSGNNGNHKQLITLNGTTLATDEFYDYVVRQLSFDLPLTALTSSMQLKFQGQIAGTDQQRVSNIQLTYPRLFSFENKNAYAFDLTGGTAARYLEISNFNHGGSSPILYDVLNGQRIVCNVENNLVKVLLPGSEAGYKLLLVASSGIRQVSVLQATPFIDYNKEQGEFIIISNPLLYNDGNGKNWVREYADYRASQDGGNYKTIIVDIQQLYDQFAWGIQRHPLSIRNFAHFVKKNWQNPQYVFIIGKGREYNGVRTAAQLTSSANASFYVPTFGVPGSDNLLLSTNETATPVIPVGRIAVSKTENVELYLKKVKDYEKIKRDGQSIEDRKWVKEIIHLGGGGIASEQSLIKSNLTALENIIENNKFGGNVTSFYKSSTDPIEQSKSDQIFSRINKGVSIITFFGHSAVGTFDFNIDNPDNYNNFPKYPMIFSLGCYSGNIHTSGLGVNERFVIQRDKAAIGMVATTGQGYISSLNSMMSQFYQYLGNDYYGWSTGKLLQATIRHFDIDKSTQPELIQQITYHGDPALTIFSSQGPDYYIDPASVIVSPNSVNILQDSFIVKFSIMNLGKNTGDSVSCRIEHEMPNGNRFAAAFLKIKSPTFSTTVELKLSTIGKKAVGKNHLFIIVDYNNQVYEFPLPAAELNNELTDASGNKGIPFFIIENGAIPIHPSNFAIVANEKVVLRAYTPDPLAPVGKYLMEIDTTAVFNSPFRKSTYFEQAGGIIEWTPEIDFEKDKVYFWRISPDSVNSQLGLIWETRSFTYIPGSQNGWRQSSFWQFLENNEGNLKVDKSKRTFSFGQDFIDFRIRNKLFDNSDPPNGFVNGVRWSDFFRWELQSSLTVVVFDTLGRIWFNWNPGQYGSINTTAARIGAFPFPVQTISQREKLVDFIEKVIPDGYWVFVYNAQRTASSDLKISEWEGDSIQFNKRDLFTLFEAQGAQQIRSLKNQVVPYYFAFRKNKGKILELLADSQEGVIDPEYTIPGVWFEGRTNSTIVGPAKDWSSFHWGYDSIGNIDKDTFYVNIYGLNKEQKESKILFEKILNKEVDISNVSALNYPFLRLEYYAKDSIERSPVQLKEWTVFFDGLPDAAFNPVKHYIFKKDTLEEGEELNLATFVSETTSLGMDSLLVRFVIRDDSGKNMKSENRFGKLLPNAGIDLRFAHDTKGLAGNHQLVLQLNPDNDQPELTVLNNYLIKDFYVQKDKRNPLLNVTFDGIPVCNGDIVSPMPHIQISIKDENTFLLLEDTSVLKLILLQPDGELLKISLNSPEISFKPALSGVENEFTLDWKPIFEQEGDYALIVQATDATGNNAGAFDYKVSFKVILETMLSNVLAYPNPFSTATRFVYTLTGEPPTQFKIQIMTISGRIVREITQDEIGPLKIGTHQTEFAWDGTDEFGDRLANGIYLYRVLAKDSDKQDYKLFETGADGFFNKGFGKLAIIR